MKRALMAAVAALLCTPAFAVETFDQAWASRWAPQVKGSLFTRRFEPQIKAACKEVWDVAQQNVPKPAGPLVAKNKATVKVVTKAASRRRPWRRRGLFR